MRTRDYIRVICTLDVVIPIEMEVHSELAELCLQTAKRLNEGEEGDRDKIGHKVRACQVYGLRTAVCCPCL